MRQVAVIVPDEVEPFGLGVIAEVWAEPYHPDDDNPVFDVAFCTSRPGRVRGSAGFDLHIEHGLDRVQGADLVAVAASRDFRTEQPAVSEALRLAHDQGSTIVASCTAAFLLGYAGLLDGRRATTHWRYGDEMAARFPDTEVDVSVLYVEDGPILTGAGSAAGVDTNLHLMRKAFGAATAATAARRIVMPPHRGGGQAQFVPTPVRAEDCESLGDVLQWARDRLHEPLTVGDLARVATMSERTFARRFRDETGTTPLQWLTAERVARAEQLLEQTRLSVEEIAGRCGFGSAATLRHHFTASRGTSPAAYRRQFTCLETA
ncbi:helix-turn-helix domain-containing protein [Aeromicrobium sp. YIM 150415]|uniref:GlxA family transcriptional regulator n=1 Tax=Aeromicrobium sp. YIM 150415 TaxID=2803912 RepID=UPI00196560CC|nr:helix-turn-helix domain-containing protein [Aeromicrobium sp. YIM 150415]MBM9463939.1 helix-turn-helix domain-containing protein [Aeromicrobium sp. YIM 150415]